MYAINVALIMTIILLCAIVRAALSLKDTLAIIIPLKFHTLIVLTVIVVDWKDLKNSLSAQNTKNTMLR